MARWYQLFHTMDERKAWEKEQKANNPNFEVCMRMTAKQLKKDLIYVNIGDYKYATVYRVD